MIAKRRRKVTKFHGHHTDYISDEEPDFFCKPTSTQEEQKVTRTAGHNYSQSSSSDLDDFDTRTMAKKADIDTKDDLDYLKFFGPKQSKQMA